MIKFFIPSSADILGIIAVSFLIYLIKRNEFMARDKSRYYLLVAYMTGIIIFMEIITDYLNFHITPKLRDIAFAINILGFSLMFSLPVILAILYSSAVSKKKWYALIPTLVGSILCICSISTGWIFYIDLLGLYHRGPLFWINSLIMLYGYIVLLCAHIKVAKEYDGSERCYLWMLYTIVLCMSVVQTLIPKIEVMWGTVAVIELLYYIFLREFQFKVDTVTCVRNRICFEQRLKKLRLNNALFFIEFDVNNLKYINDTYGHAVGDELLKKSAMLLKDAYQKCGMVYRIGGDEFAVIAPNCNTDKILQAREKLLALMKETQKEYKMGYYIANAYSHYDPCIHTTIAECLKEADQKMYEDKRKSKE